VDAGEPAAVQTLLLAAVFIGLGVLWLTSYALLVAKLGALLRRSRVRRTLNAVSGTVLTALGVRLALAER
jgi:threonine/homoserine/homoserine lactone efflux protein